MENDQKNQIFLKHHQRQLCVVVHNCNLRTQRLKQEDHEFKGRVGQGGLHRRFWVSLGYIARTCLRKKNAHTHTRKIVKGTDNVLKLGKEVEQYGCLNHIAVCTYMR
jgi:hypothetical protein